MSLLFIDIETRSRRDLRKVGVYRYSECPEFSILMAAWAHEDAPVQVALGEAAVRDIPGLWDPKVVKCAHNAQFERVCFSRLAGSWQDPEEWHDTMALAAEYGHPTGLDKVARALGATPKDSAGSALINLFCKPNREGGWNDATTHPMQWLDFIDYCAQDVGTLREVSDKLGKWPTEMEIMVWEADQRINDTGMQIDRELAIRAQEASEANRMEQELQVMSLTGVANPGSTQQMMAWAQSAGLDLPNMQAETIQAALDGELDPTHRRVLELRQELALAAASKYTAALDTVSADGRVRGGFWFFGAHTGRWAGRGLQPHNLPRAAFATELEAEEAILNLKLDNGATQLELKKLVRALFVGPFTVVDYAAIEARVVAWLANELWALEAFKDGRDIYVETAERLGGMTRFQGKIAVLALGYNGGINSLKALAGDKEALQKIARPPSMVDERWLTPEEVDEGLQKIVNVWRRANARIVHLWSDMAEAVEDGGQVGQHLKITRHGNSMQMHLPSGRAIHYHGVRWEKYRIGLPNGKSVIKEGWRYDDPKKPGVRIGTYGGRLVENATQAVARDILAEALVRLHAAGYTIAGHIHDEVIVEGEYPVEDIVKIMCDPPSWAKGLPIDGEGFACQRYRK